MYKYVLYFNTIRIRYIVLMKLTKSLYFPRQLRRPALSKSRLPCPLLRRALVRLCDDITI